MDLIAAGVNAVLIRRFAPPDQQAARNVILEGMREHWGVLDPTLNRDLDDIESSYADAVFMVAVSDGAVVATGALVPRDDDCGEIVRMSTLREYRRRGVARRVLRTLVDEAAAREYVHLRLATAATWSNAIAFYEAFGMVRIPDASNRSVARFELTL